MLLKVSPVLFFVIFVVGQEPCPGPNEAFNECGTNCNQNCGENVESCPFQCNPGCYCNRGFRRNRQNICVPEDQCPNTSCTGINEFYTTCGNNCTDQCNNNQETCSKNCQVGCFCANGYKRNSAGICVPPQQCFCNSEREEYKTADRCCELCDPTFCSQKYETGCFCKEGYKRDQKTGNCVLKEACPKSLIATLSCDKNEVVKCSNKCLEMSKEEQGEGCTKECYYGCFCKDGYVRCSKTKKCVKPQKYVGYYFIPHYHHHYMPCVN